MKKITLTANSNTTLASDKLSGSKLRKLLLACLLMVFTFGSEISYSQFQPAVITGGAAAHSSMEATHGLTPFAKGKNKSRVMFLYEKGELNTIHNKQITHVGFFVTNLNNGVEGPKSLNNVTVKVYLVDNTSAANFKQSNSNMHFTGASTPVVDFTVASISITSTGWMDLSLGSGFFYDKNISSKESIVVEICSDNTGNTATQSFAVKMREFGTSFRMARGRFNTDNGVTNLPSQAACALPPSIVAANLVANNYSPLTTRNYRPETRFTFGCVNQGTAGKVEIADAGTGCAGSPVMLKVDDADDVSGLSYKWRVSLTGANGSYADIPGATEAKYTATRQMEPRWYMRQQSCALNPLTNSESTPKQVPGSNINKFNGSSWSFYNGSTWSASVAPNGSATSEARSIVIESGTYTITSDVKACSCQVNEGATLIVESGKTLSLKGPIVAAPDVNASVPTFIFNDGASLIQPDYVVNTGNIIYKRKSQPMVQYDYTYWSAPVANNTFERFVADGAAHDHLYSFSPTTQNWVSHAPVTEMIPGRGYIVRAPEPSPATPTMYTGEFLGKPNNGTYTAEVKAGGYALVGNPYPSALNADSFILDSNNEAFFTGTLYFWTHYSGVSTAYAGNGSYSNYNNDDYATYNLTGMIGDNAPSNPSGPVPTNWIGAGQSFMIVGSDVDGAVTFTNDMRPVSGGNNGQFFRSTETQTASDTQIETTFERNRVWLQIANTSNFKQTLVGYITGASDEIDRGYDGKPMSSSPLAFYSLVSNQKFAIQGRSLPFNVADVVPLGFKTNVAGSHTVSMYKFDGLFDNVDVYLEDTLLGIMHNLKNGDYTFSTAAGTFDSRFVLKYGQSALSTGDVVVSNEEVVVIKKNAGLHINSQSVNLKDVKVFDLSGRLLTSRSNIGSQTTSFENMNWSSQVIIVQTLTDNDVLVTKKVVF